MINQLTLVGYVVEKPVIKKYDDGFSATTLTLAVTRPFKNMEGNYDCDFIKISLWNGVAQSTCDYTNKGDVLGVRARLASKEAEYNFEIDGQNVKRKINVLEVIGERVVFISTGRKKEPEVYVSPQENE